MLISIKTYRIYDFLGEGGDWDGRCPDHITPIIRACTYFVEFKVIFLAHFNYVKHTVPVSRCGVVDKTLPYKPGVT